MAFLDLLKSRFVTVPCSPLPLLLLTVKSSLSNINILKQLLKRYYHYNYW